MMFENKKITMQKVKDLVYSIQMEFENELDYDYTPKYREGFGEENNKYFSKTFEELCNEDKTFTSEEVMCIMDSYINQFTGKLFDCIDDEFVD